MDRREFLLSGLALLAPRASFAASATIEIFPDEPIGTISSDIYGHFTEHLKGRWLVPSFKYTPTRSL